MIFPFFWRILVIGPGVLLVWSGIFSSRGADVRAIADSSTAIPGGAGMFRQFDTPVYHASQIAFGGTGSSNQAGIYFWENGRLSLVADRNTFVPGSGERFRQFYRPTVENGTVYFAATAGTETNFHYGLYRWREGKLSIIADRNTAVPGGRGKFLSFNAPFSRAGRVIFVGRHDGNSDPNEPVMKLGLFVYDGGALRKLVDQDDLVPGKNVSFSGFNHQGEAAFDFDGQRAVFLGLYGTVTPSNPELTRILCSVTMSGEVHALADAPEFSFDDFWSRPRLDGKAVVFSAIDKSFGEPGMFVSPNEMAAPVLIGWWFNEVSGIGRLSLSGQPGAAWPADGFPGIRRQCVWALLDR
jgi:hypothetical protein